MLIMLCAQRVQRLMMAIMLGIVLMLAGSGMLQAAFVLQVFIMIMIIVWALTNFCPSIWFLQKVLGDCDFEKKSNNE
jgi:hypothetical protein